MSNIDLIGSTFITGELLLRNINRFREIPFLARFEAAAEAGFKGVEFLFPYEYSFKTLNDCLTKNHLELVLFNTPPGNTDKNEWRIGALPGREKEVRQHIDKTLEYACELDCKQVHIMAGIIPEGLPTKDYEYTFLKNLEYASRQFSSEGKILLLEALSPATKANYFYSSQYQVIDILNKLDNDNIFLQFDIYHAQQVDGNLTNFINKQSARIKHIQIASLPGRNEPDRGEINYDYIYSYLEKINYKYWIGCEYTPCQDTKSGLEWFRKIKAF